MGPTPNALASEMIGQSFLNAAAFRPGNDDLVGKTCVQKGLSPTLFAACHGNSRLRPRQSERIRSFVVEGAAPLQRRIVDTRSGG